MCQRCYNTFYRKARRDKLKSVSAGVLYKMEGGKRVPVKPATCHPDRPVAAKGLCGTCYYYHQEPRPPKAEERPCLACKKPFIPVGKGLREVVSEDLFCSSRCQLMAEAMSEGDLWKTTFPGAKYQKASDAPKTCPHGQCGGALFENETGLMCLNCGRSYPVAERLVRSIMEGRDDAYAMLQYTDLLDAIER